jgi:hypothetical protein
MNTAPQKMPVESDFGLSISRSDSSMAGNSFDEIIVGRRTKISFNRTLRIPEDGKTYPLPAGMGRLPIHRVENYADKVPESWLKEGGYFIPLYQSEALFLEFNGPNWHPTIAKVCVGKINAISGESYSEKLSSHKQDYVVIPDQHWLDGINSGNGVVRQFVAMPIGKGYTIEAQITDEEIHGGFQLLIFDSVDGVFPDRNPAIDKLIGKIRKARNESLFDDHFLDFNEKQLYLTLFGRPVETRPRPILPARGAGGSEVPCIRFALAAGPAAVMGIAAGGSIEQMIIADSYGVDSWDVNRKRGLTIHLVNSLSYKEITGNAPPPSPITKHEYEYHGIPWYSYYDEKIPKISGSSLFRRILGVSEIANRRGDALGDSKRGINISPEIIQKIRTPDAAEAAKISRSRAYESAAKSEWKRALSEISNAIDLGEEKKESDYTLRCCCNYNLGNYTDGEVDGSLGLEINQDSKDARSWRAYCRLASGDHEGLKEDADVLISRPETAIFGFEMRASAAMLSGRYSDAITDALNIKKLDKNHARADLILTKARAKAARNSACSEE